MKFTVTESVVPPGIYRARLDAVEEVEHEVYGPGARWGFVIAAGDYTGRRVCRVTSPSPTRKNSCGKMLSGVLGRPITTSDVDVSIDEFVGNEYQVVIEETGAGGCRVETVLPVNGEREATPVTAEPVDEDTPGRADDAEPDRKPEAGAGQTAGRGDIPF